MIERTTITDELGIAWDVEMETIEDCCPTCRGCGVVTFSTPQDLANHEASVCECCGHCECDTPSQSGVAQCGMCGGSGHVAGAGPLHKMRCSLPFNFTALPQDLWPSPPTNTGSGNPSSS